MPNAEYNAKLPSFVPSKMPMPSKMPVKNSRSMREIEAMGKILVLVALIKTIEKKV